jgi:hypothetical protein
MKRPNGVMKIDNEYSKQFKFYNRIPKAVFAAVCCSKILLSNNENFELIEGDFMNEWRILYESGIIKQKPKKFRKK